VAVTFGDCGHNILQMALEPQEAYRSLERGDFLPYFQPYVVLRTGKLRGFELLARWKHPVHGWVSPDDFIPAAERDGWIGALTRELLREGFAAMAVVPRDLCLSVNISPLQLHDLSLPEQIRHIAEGTGFSLNRLMIEITESALMDNLEASRVVAKKLKDMGCKLALDDFGTGYSSLSQLRSLPFDELKVDRSFVKSMTEERESRKIVVSVVGLGQSLGLITVAEGVETQEEAEMLLWLGCEQAQGWLFGRPVPREDLAGAVNAARPKIQHSRSSSRARRISSSTLEMLPAQRFAQLRAIYDGAPVGLAFLDRNMRYVSMNKTLADMNGVPMEEHLGRTVEEVLPQLYPIVEGYIRRALQGEAIPGTEIIKPASGQNPAGTIFASYQPARDEAGEVIGVQVGIVDITALKVAEKQRQESEKHFRYMMELLPQIPWVIDPQGRALDVSQRWLEITGTTDDQWRGFGWLDALHPEDRQPTIDAMHESFRTGNPIDLEYRVRRSGGEWKWMRARGAARIGADGKIVCWYGSLEDVDEQRRYQTARQGMLVGGQAG
jgi:PAS domain S-box-containing protein